MERRPDDPFTFWRHRRINPAGRPWRPPAVPRVFPNLGLWGIESNRLPWSAVSEPGEPQAVRGRRKYVVPTQSRRHPSRGWLAIIGGDRYQSDGFANLDGSGLGSFNSQYRGLVPDHVRGNAERPARASV